MDRPQGRIIELIPDAGAPRAVVEMLTAVRCPRCAEGKGCGAGLVGGDESPRRVEALVPGHLELRKGDQVWLDLASRDLLHAALVAYGAPLAGMLVAAAAVYLAAVSDLQAILATLLGGFVGAVGGRTYLHRRGCLRSMTPRVTGHCPAGGKD
jgi:sigma-E factor negative regulatory protein RseC